MNKLALASKHVVKETNDLRQALPHVIDKHELVLVVLIFENLPPAVRNTDAKRVYADLELLAHVTANAFDVVLCRLAAIPTTGAWSFIPPLGPRAGAPS